jgi:N-acetylmuramoyl-L-alanine amidase
MPSAGQMNHNLVIIDPAHGGPDAGTTLDKNVPEKFTTLALAGRLRNALSSAGFTVVSTRDADSSDPLTTDQRAETANRGHAVACIVLHATNTGAGVHVYTSSLQPSEPDDSTRGFIPVSWDSAQAAFVTQSQRLAGDLSAAFAKWKLPARTGKASVRPLDNVMCPAVAIEIAPLRGASGDSTPDTDPGYQQHVADAVASALRAWRTHADPPASPGTPQEPDKPATAPAPKRTPPASKVAP